MLFSVEFLGIGFSLGLKYYNWKALYIQDNTRSIITFSVLCIIDIGGRCTLFFLLTKFSSLCEVAVGTSITMIHRGDTSALCLHFSAVAPGCIGARVVVALSCLSALCGPSSLDIRINTPDLIPAFCRLQLPQDSLSPISIRTQGSSGSPHQRHALVCLSQVRMLLYWDPYQPGTRRGTPRASGAKCPYNECRRQQRRPLKRFDEGRRRLKYSELIIG